MTAKRTTSNPPQFTQIPIAVLFDKKLKPADVMVYAYLLWRQGKNDLSHPSIIVIGRDLHLSTYTVQPSLRRLIAARRIIKESPERTGRGFFNRYVIPCIETKEPAKAPDGFDAFWEIYPKHRSKKQARETWDKLKPSGELFDQILTAAAAVARRAAGGEFLGVRDKIQYCRNPSTWLSDEAWTEEVDEPEFATRDLTEAEADALMKETQ